MGNKIQGRDSLTSGFLRGCCVAYSVLHIKDFFLNFASRFPRDGN